MKLGERCRAPSNRLLVKLTNDGPLFRVKRGDDFKADMRTNHSRVIHADDGFKLPPIDAPQIVPNAPSGSDDEAGLPGSSVSDGRRFFSRPPKPFR